MNSKKIVCFHNPDEENGYLSNWYLSDFTVDEIKYSSMEQYMMYRKALLFDEKIAAEILNNSDVGKIKALGRSVRNYNDTIWNGMRQPVVCRGLLQKFSQNEELKEKLLETGDKCLAECAVQDRVWGIGLSMKDENRFEMNKWRGENLLGFSLCFVRDILKGE